MLHLDAKVSTQNGAGTFRTKWQVFGKESAMIEVVKFGEYPDTVNDMRDGVFYPVTSLAAITLPRGRRLDEALRNDPSAPAFIDLQGPGRTRNGKYYTKSIIASFVASFSDALVYGEHLDANAAQIANAAAKALERGRAEASKIKAEAKDAAEAMIAQTEAQVAKIRSDAAREAYEHLMKQFAQKAPLDCATGVYFLFKKGKLQYVGQSINVYSRIQQHRGNKDFDQAKFIACHRSKLDDMEGFFIRLLEPPLNGGATPLERSCPKSQTWERMFSLSFVPDGDEMPDRMMTISNGMVTVYDQ